MINNNYLDEDPSVSEESFMSASDDNNYRGTYDNDETIPEPEEDGEDEEIAGEDDDYDDYDYDDADYDGEDNQSDEFDEEGYSEDEVEEHDIETEGSLGAVINNRRRGEQNTMNGTIELYPQTYTNGPINYDVHDILNVDDYIDVTRNSQPVLGERYQSFIDTTLRLLVDWSSEIYEDYEMGSEIYEEENEEEHLEFIEPIDALLGPDDQV